MHNWGDDWFEKNSNDLDAAITYIGRTCRIWGRIGGDYKEKYGTVRFYAHFHHNFHDLIWAGYVYIQYPFKWMHWLDMKITYSRLYQNTIGKWIQNYQTWLYATSYLRAIKKWPHLRKEILCCADYKELFPIDICRKAHENTYRSAFPGELVYLNPFYHYARAVVSHDKILILQNPEGGYYEAAPSIYHHWDGCGIS